MQVGFAGIQALAVPRLRTHADVDVRVGLVIVQDHHVLVISQFRLSKLSRRALHGQRVSSPRHRQHDVERFAPMAGRGVIGEPLERAFHILLSFLEQRPIASANTDCRVGVNEVYARVSGMGADLAEIARDETDYKRLIARAGDRQEKIALGQKLATRRLARGVVPELDACFAALNLGRFVSGDADVVGVAS